LKSSTFCKHKKKVEALREYLLIMVRSFTQHFTETTPLQSGNFEQPQNSFPECGPFFATRKTISLPHLGHARETSG
jgi:hypothetical protein